MASHFSDVRLTAKLKTISEDSNDRLKGVGKKVDMTRVFQATNGLKRSFKEHASKVLYL